MHIQPTMFSFYKLFLYDKNLYIERIFRRNTEHFLKKRKYEKLGFSEIN